MSNVRSLNRVILIGNVGKNPEMTVITSTGRDVAKFSLATKEGYFDANRVWKDFTEWHNIVAFGPVAKKAEKSFTKGDLVLVEGRIKSRKWTDKNSGQERTSFEIEATNLVVLEKKNREGGGGYTAPPARGGDAFQAPYDNRSAKFPTEGGDADSFPVDEEDPF